MKNSYLTIKALGATCLLAMSSVSHAAITAFSDDFSGYGGQPNMSPNWEGFSDNCGFPGGYTFAPSTSGPQISAIADDSGNDVWNVYGNYDNAACLNGTGPNPVENISVFRNFAYTGADTADSEIVVFDFDYREAIGAGPDGATEVGAFIRVFDGAFNLLADATLDTAGSETWQAGQLSLVLNPIWTEGFFQVGFNNALSGFDDSGMNYDNAALSIVPIPAAVWLFGSALGLLGFARRRKA